MYLDVRDLRPGDERGIGKEVALFTKGWLPYALKWRFGVAESDPPRGFTLDATGDFAGRGEWTFTQDGEVVDITSGWRIRVDKPLLRYGSWVFKPIFAANHRWAMARGEESLPLELARRHAASEAERERIPPPPGPTRLTVWPGLAALAAAVSLLTVARVRRMTTRG